MRVRFYLEFLSFFFFFFFFFGGVLTWGGFLFLEWELVSFSSIGWELEFLLDGISLIFLSVVAVVTGCVLRFSGFYMGGEVNLSRFYCILGLFVLSMVALLLIPNLLGLMVGWDGLGVVSYLLVIYYPCSGSLSAGMVTFLTNRLGDSFLMCGLVLLGLGVGDWCLVFDYGFIGFLVGVGSVTKSAQYPFSAWLPAAMAAPTPVSSLVHSSTLVTAGVYLLIRCQGSLSGGCLEVLYWSSLLTLLVSGCAACFEFDLKKVVALSTLSHVSIMVFSLSVGLSELSFFHLVCHAVSKAMLFICVGFILMGGSQDIRQLGWDFSGNLWLKGYFIVSCASLCGISFLSGYYSKDLILEGLVGSCSWVLGFLGFFMGIVFSSWYSVRLIFYGLFSGLGCGWMGVGSKLSRGVGASVHFCCFPLFVFSVFLGGVGYLGLARFPCIMPSVWVKAFIFFAPLFGVVGFFFVVFWGLGGCGGFESEGFVGSLRLFSFFEELGFLDRLSGQVWVKPVFGFGSMCCGYVDQGWLEAVGPSGLNSLSLLYLKGDGEKKVSWFSVSFLCYVLMVFVLGGMSF